MSASQLQERCARNTQPLMSPNEILAHSLPFLSRAIVASFTRDPFGSDAMIFPAGSDLTFSGVPVGSSTLHDNAAVSLPPGLKSASTEMERDCSTAVVGQAQRSTMQTVSAPPATLIRASYHRTPAPSFMHSCCRRPMAPIECAAINPPACRWAAFLGGECAYA